MLNFSYALIALLAWSGSDLFSKMGTKQDDKLSHWRVIFAVGAIMGIHAIITLIGSLFIDPENTPGFVLSLFYTDFVPMDFIKYLPVAFVYLLAMVIGYVGLRYIELSVSSPICNSSGAIVSILCIVALGDRFDVPVYIAIALICAGVIGLGFVEAKEDDELRRLRQEKANYKYSKSALAIILPLMYCLLDAFGTFADSMVLETLDEDVANVAYELTFLVCGIASFIYVKFIKKQKYLPKKEGPKYVGAIFETIGQFAYIYALADSEHVAMAAPIISAYCVASVVWGRIFLKEKLSVKHYITIAVAVAGIIILGIYDI